MLQADHNPLILRAGALELALSPAIGGAIRDLTYVGAAGRVPLLRRTRAGAESVLDMASFPLVPYVNRIRGGRFTFRGRDVVIKPNMTGDISPLHGHGWLGAWSVERSSETQAELRFEHSAGEWPWEYEARQFFWIDEAGLSVTLTCRNQDANPMPCGLGQHPYFPCTADTRLDTGVTSAFEIDEHVLPTGQVAATGRYDLRNRPACGQNLDHGFGGWSGEARMTDPAWPSSLRLSSPNAGFFQLYSPEQGGIFVAEPVTHANAALNEPEERWADLGLRVLEPGEEMRLDMRLELAGETA